MSVFPDGPPPFQMAIQKRNYESFNYPSLSASDAQALTMHDLLKMADDESKALWENLSLAYTENRGHALLRAEVVKWHEGLDKNDVLVVVPQEGILVATKALTSHCRNIQQVERPHVVVTGPAFQSIQDDLRFFGCEVTYWPIQYSITDGWYFDVADLKSVLQADTKILVTNFPHNPTGFLPTENMWQEIIQICKERDMYLFSDEIYRFSVHDESPPLTPACSLYEKAITLGGLSKTHGLPGLRIGWLCTKDPTLMNALMGFKDYTSICSSAPSEILAIIALRNSETLVKRVNTLIKHNLKILAQFFERYSDLFEWHPPRACTTVFVKLKPKALGIGGGDASGFCQIIRKEAELLGSPASMYNYQDEYMRFGFARQNLPQMLDRLEKFLENQLKK